MIIILSIETATRTCSVALHQGGVLVGSQEMHRDKSHSALLHTMIDGLLRQAEVSRSELSGIALSMGPGSYTGLRIGASAAKGLCYALDIPLLGISTLTAMAHGMDQYNPNGAWLCPMIDARRMEVFCCVQRSGGEELLAPQPVVVTAGTFEALLEQHELWFFGDGSDKCRSLLAGHPHARFVSGVVPLARWVGELAVEKFIQQDFEDVAYSVPHYGKAFRTTPPRKKAVS